MDLIERIGAVLGLAAFLGLAVLALLYFQQARDVRRLREWAGKAPERAAAAAAEATIGQPAEEREPPVHEEGFLARVGASVRSALAAIGSTIARAWRAVDRRSPIDLRIAAAAAAIGVVVAVVLVAHPFGLLEDDKGDGEGGGPSKLAPPPGEIEVSIVNGTTASAEPVEELAGQVEPVVKQADYDVGRLGDSAMPFESSVIMYVAGHKVEASTLATDLAPELGEIPVEPIDEEIRELAAGAGVALVVGPDIAAEL